MFEQRDGMLRNILTREVPALAAEHAHRVLATVLGRSGAAQRRRRRLDHACRRTRRAARARAPLRARPRRIPLQRGDAARVRQPVERVRLLRAGGRARRRRACRLVVAVVVRCRLQLPRRVAAASDDRGIRRDGAARASRRRRSTTSRRRSGARSARAATCAASTRSWARAASSRARLRARCRRDTARPLRILELGCGDGRLMLGVARHRGASLAGGALDLLDRQPIVDAGDDRGLCRARAGSAGRSSPTSLDWAVRGDERASAGTSSSPTCSCTTSRAKRSAGCSRHARAAPSASSRASRGASRFALAASHLIVFLGANAVTRHDGVLSVHAGFVDNELATAWPRRGRLAWRLDEYDGRRCSRTASARGATERRR